MAGEGRGVMAGVGVCALVHVEWLVNWLPKLVVWISESFLRRHRRRRSAVIFRSRSEMEEVCLH